MNLSICNSASPDMELRSDEAATTEWIANCSRQTLHHNKQNKKKNGRNKRQQESWSAASHAQLRRDQLSWSSTPRPWSSAPRTMELLLGSHEAPPPMSLEVYPKPVSKMETAHTAMALMRLGRNKSQLARKRIREPKANPWCHLKGRLFSQKNFERKAPFFSKPRSLRSPPQRPKPKETELQSSIEFGIVRSSSSIKVNRWSQKNK